MGLNEQTNNCPQNEKFKLALNSITRYWMIRESSWKIERKMEKNGNIRKFAFDCLTFSRSRSSSVRTASGFDDTFFSWTRDHSARTGSRLSRDIVRAATPMLSSAFFRTTRFRNLLTTCSITAGWLAREPGYCGDNGVFLRPGRELWKMNVAALIVLSLGIVVYVVFKCFSFFFFFVYNTFDIISLLRFCLMNNTLQESISSCAVE